MLIGIEQAMQMNDDIAHFGIVNRALRRAAPCLFGQSIVGIDTDDIDGIEIGKFEPTGVLDATPEDEMQFVHANVAFGWGREPRLSNQRRLVQRSGISTKV